MRSIARPSVRNCQASSRLVDESVTPIEDAEEIVAATPGKLPKDWQTEAESFIEKELVDLGLLKLSDIKKQDPDDKAFRKYFMHGVGHPLGLDVHDLGLTTGPIQKGWVLTVEPAIYLKDEGFAVRLENDILVGDNGNTDLMAKIPIEADDIEHLMNR